MEDINQELFALHMRIKAWQHQKSLAKRHQIMRRATVPHDNVLEEASIIAQADREIAQAIAAWQRRAAERYQTVTATCSPS